MHTTLSAKNLCMRAHATVTVQKILCHGSYSELIWSLVRASCRLSFLPALLLSRPNQSPVAVRSRNPSKSTLAHDAVAAAMSHKHHSIIRVGAGLIQFVYGSHSRLAVDLILHTKFYFHHVFRGLFQHKKSCDQNAEVEFESLNVCSIS